MFWKIEEYSGWGCVLIVIGECVCFEWFCDFSVEVFV